MSVPILNCRNCGAPAPADSVECAHCHSVLAAISCPECLGLMFKGAKFCPHCGATAQREEMGPTGTPCPGCKAELNRTSVGPYSLSECVSCHGVWAEAETLAAITAQAEKGTLPEGSPLNPADLPPSREDKVRYKKCPHCSDLMNRNNFARCSGIIVDSCRLHGTWFDHGEIQRVIHFVRNGGLGESRQREKADIAEARRQLERARSFQSIPSSALEPKRPVDGADLAVSLLSVLVEVAINNLDN